MISWCLVESTIFNLLFHEYSLGKLLGIQTALGVFVFYVKEQDHSGIFLICRTGVSEDEFLISKLISFSYSVCFGLNFCSKDLFIAHYFMYGIGRKR